MPISNQASATELVTGVTRQEYNSLNNKVDGFSAKLDMLVGLARKNVAQNQYQQRLSEESLMQQIDVNSKLSEVRTELSQAQFRFGADVP